MKQDLLAKGLASQMLASLYTLKECIDRCPDLEWNEKHNDYPYCQVVFHTLFDCDLSLSDNIEELKSQQFHAENTSVFGNYEELDDSAVRRNLYDREFINKYYTHCIEKIEKVIGRKEIQELLIENNDVYRNMTKNERYINCIRHIQHHAAQLGFRLQLLTSKEMNWVSRGYSKNE